MPVSSTMRWPVVVVDGCGRVDWTFTGDDERALLVLVCRTTPAGYLARLRDLGVGYLLVGDASVDLDAQAALSLADQGYVLEVGKIVLSGTGQELLTSDDVRKAYLGVG